ncbi:MAG TPA: diguanylate cyclase [Rikenellaceae bacterium]|nr:MAG: hypothetical protein A2X20_08330 [Bacteroidetes bacterium GWE2_40_15]HBZ25918.1 diguanylate cyclase [Rikenellaceae bacterium]
MMEKLEIPKGDKDQIYKSIIPQIHALIQGEEDLYANLANVVAALKEAFGHFWVGFYLVKADSCDYGKKLVLGPFQGPIACTRIAYGKGVCGTAWKERATVVVYDVEQFPGHIACSSHSRSEIVVPIFSGSEVFAVLDIDSTELGSFDDTDAKYLEQLFPQGYWDSYQFSL